MPGTRPGMTNERESSSLIFIRDVADDLPAAVGLLAEDVHAGLLRDRPGRRAGRLHLERPDQPHDGEIAGYQDLLDVERIGIAPGLVAERTLQQLADVVEAALGMAAIVVAQVAGEQSADLRRIAGVERARPFAQHVADRGFGR